MTRSLRAPQQQQQQYRPIVLPLLLLVALFTVRVDGAPFSVALWGDLPYYGNSDNIFDVNDPVHFGNVSVGVIYNNLRDSINNYRDAYNDTLRFSMHAGDVKLSTKKCYEHKWFSRFEDLANSLDEPVFLALGDNDWTDCYGDFDWSTFSTVTQTATLQYVRQRFYDQDFSGKPRLGSNKESWTTTVATGGKEYPELQRFLYQDIMFVVVHVVGSNNNRRSTCFSWDSVETCFFNWPLFFSDFCCCQARAEYTKRNAKVNEFLKASFQQAKDAGAKGVVVLGQAHIVNFNKPPGVLFGDGFNEFWATLTSEALSFVKPVVYVHGDSHYFKEYIPDAVGIPNLQALMVPGEDSIGWVSATIDGDASPVFSFKHEDLTPAGYTPD